jgi:hypothetical protein
VDLETLDLSDAPRLTIDLDVANGRPASPNNPWPMFFRDLSKNSNMPPIIEKEDLVHFDYLHHNGILTPKGQQGQKADAEKTILENDFKNETEMPTSQQQTNLYTLLKAMVNKQHHWEEAVEWHPHNEHIEQLETNAARHYLHLRLRWLGLPDFRDKSLSTPHFLLWHFLPLCANLQTLSIRGEYRAEVLQPNLSAHDYLCRFVWSIRECTPESVTALELRLSIPFLERLTEAIRSKPKMNIAYIGIDLGAWVQTYPVRNTSDKLDEASVMLAIVAAAQQACYEIYEQEHDAVLPLTSKWLLPKSQLAVNEARTVYDTNFYCDAGVSDLEDVGAEDKTDWMNCNTKDSDDDAEKHHEILLNYMAVTRVEGLPAMLCKLHDSLSESEEDVAAATTGTSLRKIGIC